jgi:hypothetical protein
VALNTGRQLRWRQALVLMGCTAALARGAGSTLQAQTVELRPLADLSFPTRFSMEDGTIHVRQKVGLALGARMTLICKDRFDVVTAVTYSPGYATLHGAGKRIDLATGAHSLGASTGARYWLLPPARKFSWEVHTGVGLVFGGQPSYEDLLASSTLSGVLGTTLAYQIGRIVSLKLRIQERLCRFSFGSRVADSSSRPLQMSFGLGFPFLESLR